MDECSTVVLLMYGVVKELLTTDFLQLILGRIQDNSFPKIMVAFWYSIQNTKKYQTVFNLLSDNSSAEVH